MGERGRGKEGMSTHSLIEHRANYFYIKLEDDYLALCERVNEEIEALDLPDRQSSGPADCKGMILSVLEHWMNSKRVNAQREDDLAVYFTYEEWEQQLRYRYKRSTIIRCLTEMKLEGQWMDAEGEVHTGLIKVRHHVQNTYAYALNVKVIQGLLSQLPEQSPYSPHPKTPLGRPKKNRSKINGLKTDDIKINGLKTDGISENPFKNTRNNAEIPSKNTRSFYTQITYTDLSNTQITGATVDATVNAPALSSSRSAQNDPSSEDEENNNPTGVGSNDEPPTTAQCDPNRVGTHPDHDVALPLASPRVPVQDPRRTQGKQPDRVAGQQQTSAKPTESARSRSKTELTPEQKTRARALKMRIEDNCGALNEKGACIGENKAIATLVQKYSDADIDDTAHYLAHCHFKWSKDEYKHQIRGYIILQEIESALKLFAEKPYLRDAESPPVQKTPSRPADGPRYPKLPPVPPEWRAKHAAMMAGGR